MDVEKIIKARKKCHEDLMTCTKKEVVELFIEVLGLHFPEKMVKIATALGNLKE